MNVGFGGKADIAIEIQKCPLMTQSGLTEQYGLLAVQWLSKRQIPALEQPDDPFRPLQGCSPVDPI
jgi:hypothetical protein